MPFSTDLVVHTSTTSVAPACHREDISEPEVLAPALSLKSSWRMPRNAGEQEQLVQFT